LLILAAFTVLSESKIDRVQKILISERLGEKLDGARLQSPTRSSGCRHVRS
jgi:hypothetical protein